MSEALNHLRELLNPMPPKRRELRESLHCVCGVRLRLDTHDKSLAESR